MDESSGCLWHLSTCPFVGQDHIVVQKQIRQLGLNNSTPGHVLSFLLVRLKLGWIRNADNSNTTGGGRGLSTEAVHYTVTARVEMFVQR